MTFCCKVCSFWGSVLLVFEKEMGVVVRPRVLSMLGFRGLELMWRVWSSIGEGVERGKNGFDFEFTVIKIFS